MEDLGFERVHGRPIRLFRLSRWEWIEPTISPFTLLVVAHVDDDEISKIQIRHFATDAVASGCGSVNTWGQGCELVHDLFDHAALSADRFIMSSWHTDVPLSDALYESLVIDFPPDEAFPDADNSGVVLAVEDPWLAEVQRLVHDQDELASLYAPDVE
jgi:hypothetical protein